MDVDLYMHVEISMLAEKFVSPNENDTRKFLMHNINGDKIYTDLHSHTYTTTRINKKAEIYFSLLLFPFFLSSFIQ